ncbi:MAG TPA: Rab family GTPase [Candidatus Lokiarchaeia archaeon]|nr:Rab family GTPase [Candidatus Lokiarchaeia archaeon]
MILKGREQEESATNSIQVVNEGKSNLMPGTSLFKVVVCGDANVGKTSLIMQFVEQKFSEQYVQTIGTNFAITDVPLADDESVKLHLWDLAGQDKFAFVRPQFYKGTHGAMLVYDLTNRESFDTLHAWKEEVTQNANKTVIFYLFGNKSDLDGERVITTAEGEEMAQDLGAVQFWETSAKTGDNVIDAFHAIAETLFSAA